MSTLLYDERNYVGMGNIVLKHFSTTVLHISCGVGDTNNGSIPVLFTVQFVRNENAQANPERMEHNSFTTLTWYSKLTYAKVPCDDDPIVIFTPLVSENHLLTNSCT